MRAEATAEEDIAFALEPCTPRVATVSVVGSLILHVLFEDGLQGEVEFLPSHLTGVFESLKDPEFFSQVYVDSGAVNWPGELDLAPDAMYETVSKHGKWVLR
jgi:hypothetical protein